MMTSVEENWNDTVARAYDEGFPLLMPRWGYVVSAFVLFLIGFFGFFLNLLVILLMFKDRQLWTPLNIILFNLVCSDFSVSVLGNPFTLISALFHRWVFGQTLCVIYGFFMALLGITSITTLTVLSFERYMMVTRPLSSHHLSSKGAVVSIMFIWTYSLALTTPPLMGWGNYVSEAANISCSVNWHEQSMNTLTYILFLFAMGQIVPLAVITFSYVNIVRTLKRNSQRLGRVNRAEAKVTAMVFVMIISFTVAWTPYSVFALMEQFATAGIISPGAGVIPALVAKSSICYDPLIYVGMNTQFRQSIKRFFGIHKTRHSQAEKGYDNTIMSPAHKISGLNEVTTRYNCSDTISSSIKKPKEKKIFFTDDIPESNNYTEALAIKPYQNMNLCTIIENKTASDAKSSGETVTDEDSSNNDIKLNVFGESCNLFHDHSPVLTIIDSDKLLFSKYNRKPDAAHERPAKNVYGNRAFENDLIDIEKDAAQDDKCKKYRKLNMRHSFSLELSAVSNENKVRKYSVESSRLEAFEPPGEYAKNAVVTHFLDQASKKSTQENFRTYLYTNQDKKHQTDHL